MFNFLINSLNLPGTVTTAYYKVISKATHLAGIKQDNIRSLLITESFNYFMCYLYCFQKLDLRLNGNLGEILYHSAV